MPSILFSFYVIDKTMTVLKYVFNFEKKCFLYPLLHAKENETVKYSAVFWYGQMKPVKVFGFISSVSCIDLNQCVFDLKRLIEKKLILLEKIFRHRMLRRLCGSAMSVLASRSLPQCLVPTCRFVPTF